MKTINVQQPESGLLVLNEDGDAFECSHDTAYIEPACCSGFDAEGDCGCYGQDAIICPAWDCTGIQDWEVDKLMENLRSY